MQFDGLHAGAVTLSEGEAIGHVLLRVAVEIDLELIHTFRMVSRYRYVSGDGVTNVDHEDGSGFALEDIEVRDIQAHVLPGEG